MTRADAGRGRSMTLWRERLDGVPLLGLETLAREAGMHPELVQRFVALGLLDRAGGTAQAPLFWRGAAARLARAARLRRDLALNYAGAVLVCELLERIDELEARLRRYEPEFGMEQR